MPAACLRETICIRFGKAGAHPQLAWGIAIAPETLCLTTTFLFLKAIAILCDLLLDFCLISWCSFDLLRKCGLLAHTSPAFLKNCWSKKLFICLRLVAYSQYQKNNSNKKAEYVFSVLCFCLLCDIRNPKSCICNNLNQGIICNRMG